VVAFIDTNPLKQGVPCDGLPVLPPDRLAELAVEQVWISVLSDAEGIADWLLEQGLAEQDVVHAFPNGKIRHTLALLPRMLGFLQQVDLEGRALVEVGFGGQLFFALTLLWRGADTVCVTDVEPASKTLTRRRDTWEGYLRVLSEEFSSYRVGTGDPSALLERIEIFPIGVSATELPFEDDRFDGVVSTGVMEHVTGPDTAIHEFARVVRPGGLALAVAVGIHDHRANDPRSGFTPWSFLEETQGEWSARPSTAYYQNRWRAVDFRRAFEGVGFETLAYETRVDSSFDRSAVRAFAPEFRSGYSHEELAELDLYLASRKMAV
jgi:SAM-dependent methyltransferase